jgi:uncharacterized membrane protein
VTARAIAAFNIVLLVGHWAWSALAWQALPERIPGHFGIDGAVTRWDATTPATWFGLTLVGTVLAALCSLAGFFAHRTLPFVNMPESQRKRVRALPEAMHRQALEPMRTFLYATATCMIALFFLLQIDVYRTARDGADAGSMLLIVLLLALAPLAGIPWLSRASRERLEEVERSVA